MEMLIFIKYYKRCFYKTLPDTIMFYTFSCIILNTGITKTVLRKINLMLKANILNLCRAMFEILSMRLGRNFFNHSSLQSALQTFP